MSKRKRAKIGKTPATPSTEAGVEESADDTAVKDDMVHVTPDLLAGSPDVFASKKTEATEAEPEAELAAPEVVSEPIEPPDASTTLTREEPPALAPEPPATSPPPFVNAVAYQARPRRGGATSAIGIVLVVIGIFVLAGVVLWGDIWRSSWPRLVIIPGLILLVVGFVSIGGVGTMLW